MSIASEYAARTLGTKIPFFYDDRGRCYSLVYGPESATWTGSAWTYTQQPLQGRKALTFPNSPGVRSLTFAHTIANPPGGGTLTKRNVEQLIALSEMGIRVRLLNIAYRETLGWWNITDLSIVINQRDETHEPTSATLTWTLIESNGGGGIPAIGRSGAPGAPTTRAVVAAGAKERRWTFKHGSTLWAIAAYLLGNGNRWPEIARLNHIADPNKIAPGTVLRIPAR